MNLIEYLITHKTIIAQADARDWQGAVKLGTDILAAAKTVEWRYYDEILKSVHLHGPYFVIAPGIAMPHARPECGVNQTSYSLVTLKTPIEFGHDENDPVDILLTLAAVDKKALNEDAIIQVMTLFESEESVLKLRAARNTEEVIEVLKHISLSVASGL